MPAGIYHRLCLYHARRVYHCAFIPCILLALVLQYRQLNNTIGFRSASRKLSTVGMAVQIRRNSHYRNCTSVLKSEDLPYGK